jgi:rhomboid protease GluP
MTEDPLMVSSSTDPLIDQLTESILSEIQGRHGLDLSDDPAALVRIREAVQAAVLELGSRNQAIIDLPFISANNNGPIHYQRRIERKDIGLDTLPASSPAPDEPQNRPERIKLKLPDIKPLVTIGLLVTMVLLYILQELTAYLFTQDLPAALGMKINEAIVAGQYWRLFTPMFLHGSILHLGFNLYALYILGRRAESFFGHWRFLGLFVLGGISGNLFSFLFTSSPSLGSSTAIFGLLAAEGVFIYQHQQLYGDRFKTALRQIIQVAVINFLIGLSPGIDNWGHFGGLLGGLAFSWFAGPAYEIAGSPPLLELVDRRPEERSAVVFAIQLLVLVCLSAIVIALRS